MGYIVRMPQLGMSMEEGEVVDWTIKEGEAVKAGTRLAVVESEKAIHEVEAREAGVLRRILVSEGNPVEPGTAIGIVAGSDEKLAEYEGRIEGDTKTRTASSVTNHVAADDPAAPTPEDVRATPGARRLAEERGIDLSGVEGTGPQGVVTEDDVEAAIETEESDAMQAGETVSLGASVTVSEVRELSDVQRSVGERLGRSYREAVHVTLNRSFDTEALLTVLNAADAVPEASAVSITDLMIEVASETLSRHPAFNAHFEDGEHRLIEKINVGVAVDVEQGLVTPVVSEVDQRSAESVAEVRGELTERVRSGELAADDLSGGTFTVSNLGPFGVDDFDPVIDPPQVAILGVGRIREDGTMTLSLSFDHRVLNGADAARFLDTLVETATDEAALAGFFEADLDVDGGLDEREVVAENPGGVSGEYRTTSGTVPFDEPVDLGGSGSAPSPVDHLLGALGSCLSIAFRQHARRDGVDVGVVSAAVEGAPTRGTLESITVTLDVGTDADSEAIEQVLTKAKRACYVSRALSEELDVSIKWVRD